MSYKTNRTLCKCPRREVLIIIFIIFVFSSSSSSWQGQWSLFRLHILIPFLGVYTNLQKATISFVMSVCPHGTRLQLDGLLENISECFFFSTICRENSSFIRIWQEQQHSTRRPIYTFDHISVSSSYNVKCFRKSSTEYQNAHFVFCNFFFPENRAVYEAMWKNTVQPDGPQMTIWRMRIACAHPRLQTHTQKL